MHFIKEIPHDSMRISLFEWNSKYILKFETPDLEQSFKFSIMDISNQKEIEELATSSSFQNTIIQNFKNMYEAMSQNLGN